MPNIDNKTVRDLSNDLKVSRQTIYNKIEEVRQEIPENEHHMYIEHIGNILTVKPAGIKMIYSKLGEDYTAQTVQNDEDESNSVLLETMKTLQEQLIIKDKQLDEKDNQILKLLNTIEKQQDSINTQLKTERERGYTKALETELKKLQAAPSDYTDTKKGFIKRVKEFITGN